jgi:hypothetical protein
MNAPSSGSSWQVNFTLLPSASVFIHSSLGILSSSTNESIIVSNFAQTGDGLSAENASDEFSPISGPTWVLKKCKPPLGPEHIQPSRGVCISNPPRLLTHPGSKWNGEKRHRELWPAYNPNIAPPQASTEGLFIRHRRYHSLRIGRSGSMSVMAILRQLLLTSNPTALVHSLIGGDRVRHPELLSCLFAQK